MARTNRTNRMRLGELLVASGLVTEDKVRAGLEEQRRNNLFLGEALVRLGFVTEEAIAHAIIQHFNLPFLSAVQFNIPQEVFNLFPERMYHEYQFIAVDKIESVIIIIAAGPINQDMMEELQRVSDCRICHYVSTWKDIQSAIQRNSKELGGQAQAELTGLGSMLLDAPKTTERSATASMVFKQGESLRLSNNIPPPAASLIAPRTAFVPKSKILNSTNLSALLAPLSQQQPQNGSVSQVSNSVPPSPRLTAFLKAPSLSSAGNSAVQISSMNLPAVARSSGNLQSVDHSENFQAGASNPVNLSGTSPRPVPAAPQAPSFLSRAAHANPPVPAPAAPSVPVASEDPNAPNRQRRLSSFIRKQT